MYIVVIIQWDYEASVYTAVCDEIGLVLESDSYDRLIKRIKDSAPEMMEIYGLSKSASLCLLTRERFIEIPYQPSGGRKTKLRLLHNKPQKTHSTQYGSCENGA